MPDEPSAAVHAALLTVYEAAGQAARGQYTPDKDLGAALALLLSYGSGGRALYLAFWRACTGPRPPEANPTTTNYVRGLEAKALWRRIAADVGADVTPVVLAGFYGNARKAGERHCQAPLTAVWR